MTGGVDDDGRGNTAHGHDAAELPRDRRQAAQRRRAGDDATDPAAEIGVPHPVLDRLWPLHLVLDGDGVIRSAGRTVIKVLGRSPTGEPLGGAFDVRPTRGGRATDADVAAMPHGRLSLKARTRQRTAFRAAVATLGPGRGALLDLSFGIGVAEAVAQHGLTAADFPLSAQTVELFYLAEATDLAMTELRRANGQLAAAHREAEAHARTDPLTGVGNRRALNGAMERAMTSARGFAVIAFDLDRFKPVNDTLGHGAGDRVLRHVASVLSTGTRPEDTVARLGGDEFVVVLSDLDCAETATGIAARLLAGVDQPIPYGDGTVSVSSSAGIAIRAAGPDGPGRDAILAAADRALYAAKADGRGCVRVAEGTDRIGTARPAAE